MAYRFDFSALDGYWPLLAEGVLATVGLAVVATTAGIAIGVAGAAARTSGRRPFAAVATAYVEAIRNTPFLVQLFFVFFGLPSLGIRLSEWEAAGLAMAINMGAYSTEIIRAGIEATPRGLIEAGASLAMSRAEVFRHVVLAPALKRVWPALSSQAVIVMLGSAVCSQIAVEETSFAANFIQSRTFRPFEAYFVATLLYLCLAVLLRWGLTGLGDRLFGRRRRA